MTEIPTARHLMTTPVEVLRVGSTLSEASRILSESNFHHLPVVDDDLRIVGIVSATDLLRISLDAYGVDEEKAAAVVDQQFDLGEVMTKNPATIGQSESLRTAAELLAPGTFHALPVLDDDGRLTGMLTSTDMIELLVELLRAEE